jgi:phosphate:Na+ symporter
MLETPAIGIQQSYSELIRMGEGNKQMLALVDDVVSANDVDKDKVDRIFSLEIKIDMYQKEVVEYLSHILTGTVSLEVSDRARAQVRIADELESISDYITNLLKLNLKMRNTDLTFSDQGRVELAALHNIVETYLQMIFDAMAVEDGSVLNKAQVQGNAITYAIKESRGKHLHRVADGSTKPLASLIFTDTLNAYRRIKDHALNIGEVLSGEK